MENQPMMYLFKTMGFDLETRHDAGVYDLRMTFRERD